MAKVWKVLALLLVITALVWLTTLWRWQSAHLDPSAGDLVLHLAVLPLLLTAALVTLVWGVKRLRRYAAAPTVLPAAKVAAGPAAAPAPAPAPKPAPSLPSRVLAASVQVRAGSTWKDAQSRIGEGECKAELDPQMKDDDGIAVFTAPLDDLATDGVADALEALASSRTHLPADWHGTTPTPEVLRALALLEMATASMRDAVETQWPALAAPLTPARPSAVNAAGAPLPPVVAVRVGIPSRWPLPAQQLAGAWLHQHFERVIDAGLKAAGQSRAMATAARPAVQLHVHAVDSAEALWQLMEQQLQQWQRERQPGLLWALATDSLVGDDTVIALQASNELFSGRRQQGRVPGEAAAGLLLASPTWSAPADAEPPMAMLHRASLARRDKSADASGRITPQALKQALSDTLQGTGLDAAKIEHLTTDADHRASRTAEVYETVQELLPHLDASQQALRLGLGCGDTGVARLLSCVALTAEQVQASQAPALVLGTFTPFDRLAVLMAPPMPNAAPASSPATPPTAASSAAPAGAAQAA